MLGGELTVRSRPGSGSIFTLYVPLNFSPQAQPQGQPRPQTAMVRTFAPGALQSENAELVVDDRDEVRPNDAVVLIVEDDPRFASILLQLVRDSGFKGVVTGEGVAAPGLARRFGPEAIMLDIGLPDMDGLALLDLLKRTPETRHIPVHVISADDQRGLGLSMGAFGFTSKPVERDAVLSTLEEVKSFVARQERKITLVGGEGEAAETLRQCFGTVELARDFAKLVAKSAKSKPDALVVEIGAAPTAEVIEALKANAGLSPVVIYAPQELEVEEDRRLRLAVFGGLVRVARTPGQLIDQTALLLHAPMSGLPGPAKAKLAQNKHADPVLAGRTVVVIDDDIRNIFSLASALEEYGINLRYAESGRAGLDLLKVTPDVDAMLVDIMMPDMDGYETIREVRALNGFAELPIVAVTAKAMKGDRQKCIQAGASDYVSKPVDIDQLISVLRVAIRRADAVRLVSDNIVSLMPQAS